MDARKTLNRTYRIGAAAALLLVMTVASGVYLGSQTRVQFHEIAGSWSNYAGNTEKKGIWISSIRGYLGYGGIIHNFKNYVLRQDDQYRQAMLKQIDQFDRVMAQYLAEPLPADERRALNTIQAVIAEYQSRLPVAMQAAAEGWDVAKTDRKVRVSDAAAITALLDLENIWRETRRASTERIIAAVRHGETLIGVGFAALAALALAALALAYLLSLLLRDMRAATLHLSEQLTARLRLEYSEKRLAAAVEQSPATIFITDTDARILYANRRFEQSTGWSPSEVIGKTPKFLQSGDTPDEVYDEIRSRLSRGETWRGVFRNRRKNGKSYWAETTILPLLGPEGDVRNFIGIAEDITEKRLAREQVARSQKIEVAGLLAGGIAHDFKNILTTIMGAAHLAGLDAKKGSDIAYEIDQIEIAARRAQSLIGQLLIFARREPGRAVSTNLYAITNEVVRLVRASAPPTVQIETSMQDPKISVLGDPTHLHQIIMNLLHNASEAMGANPGHIRISAEILATPPDGLKPRKDGWVRLTVADDGPGMTAEVMGHLFDAFFTTKPLGKGSGLGLSVVHGLVTDMGGQIDVDSAKGKGARFILILPGAGLMAATDETPADAVPRGNERLMIVDDETEVAATFRRYLMRQGYQVEAFTSPLVALERLRAKGGKPDLLICDIVMPDMNGEDLATQLRQLYPQCPVIFCTAYRPRKIAIPGALPQILDKPIDPSTLALQVRTMLNDHPAD